jgi:iron complex transport system substrate-binding protein
LRNIYASGGRGFLHDMLLAAGGANVLADVAQEAVQVTTELVLARAPDVILELHERADWTDADTTAAAAVWSRLAAVPAVKAQRIHVLAGEGLVVPGPRVATAVERFADALHPPSAR